MDASFFWPGNLSRPNIARTAIKARNMRTILDSTVWSEPVSGKHGPFFDRSHSVTRKGHTKAR